MKTVLIMLMMCGQPDTLLVVQEDQQVYYKVHELDQNTSGMLQQLIKEEGTVTVRYYDKDMVCI